MIVWNFCWYITDDQASHKHRNFTHPNDQLDLYMFVLSISPFEMMALISCKSNTFLDRYRPQNGGEICYGILVATTLVMHPQSTASTEVLYIILMPPLINYVRSEHIERHSTRSL